MLPLFATNRLDLYVISAAYLIWLTPEVISSLLYSRTRGGQPRDRASGPILMTCLFAGIFLAINVAFDDPQLVIPWDRGLIFGLGILLMLAGVAFRWYAISVLGRYFTRAIAIQSVHSIVEAGPYRYIRHPSYTGAMMTLLGLSLALTNWLSIGIILLAAGIGYGYRVHAEERALIEGLGQPYRDYMMRTKRFIPFVI